MAGALLSTVTALAVPNLPAVVLIPVVMLAGIVGGGIWGAIPGALKAYLGVNEILSTIMLNIVAIQVMNYMLRDPLIDPLEIERGTRIPQTERLSENADLPILIDGTRLHLGVVIALLASVVAWIFLWRTTVGFKTRAVGHNSAAANYAGMPFKRMTMLALTYSGAMCGLAGAVLVFGSQSHRLITDGSSLGFTGSAGFNGIVAALFGGLHPLWTIPSSFLFGGLLVWRQRHAASHSDPFGFGDRTQRSHRGVCGEQQQCARSHPQSDGDLRHAKPRRHRSESRGSGRVCSAVCSESRGSRRYCDAVRNESTGSKPRWVIF